MRGVLLDANVLVYAVDRLAGSRHEMARALLAGLEDGAAVISSQVLCEYASVLTHPRKFAWEPSLVQLSVEKIVMRYRVIPVTPLTVLRAIHARARWQLAYYDAQIWASAALAGVSLVLSEDFPDGLTLGPVEFRNPFAEGFDIASL